MLYVIFIRRLYSEFKTKRKKNMSSVITIERNGVKLTMKSVTATMLRQEKIINFYNRKYNFEIEKAPKQCQRAYKCSIAIWDAFKPLRDELKTLEFNKQKVA